MGELTVPKILMVEDNEMNVNMLSRRLQKKGYQVATAGDGTQGYSLARSESPDLILMDISLPTMDGWELTRLFKSNETTRHIPIIALTAHALVTVTGTRPSRPDVTTMKPSQSTLSGSPRRWRVCFWIRN